MIVYSEYLITGLGQSALSVAVRKLTLTPLHARDAAPPKSFRFNASRTDIGALLASQRDRLIQLTQPPSGVGGVNNNNHQQLPPAYRMRGLEGAQATTISPQMYSTIDYVNVNQQRSRLQQQSTTLPNGWPAATNQRTQHQLQLTARNNNYTTTRTPQKQQLGVKLVCDIDQVFPVPEVSIYRLARLDGSHPEKLPKLDTKIERDVHSGLFHVQVTSILDDDELQLISHRYQQQQQQQQRFMMTNSAAHNQQQEPPLGDVYFECLIALTNLELSKYADNKRSITYRPGESRASCREIYGTAAYHWWRSETNCCELSDYVFIFFCHAKNYHQQANNWPAVCSQRPTRLARTFPDRRLSSSALARAHPRPCWLAENPPSQSYRRSRWH